MRARIEAAKLYPRWARRQGIAGDVAVAFRLGPGGALTRAHVLRSSGTNVLDRAAVDAVRRAAPFPRYPGPPAELPTEFTVVIAFELR